MVTANELRIGNWVNIHREYINPKILLNKITEGNEIHLIQCGQIIASGIELTEEILLKNCGMVKSSWSKTRLDFNDDIDGRSQFHIDVLNNRFVFRGLGMTIVYVDTLHHLQNLFYAVKQKELNITL